MQVTLTVSDAIVREAAQQGLSVTEFVEKLVDKGFERSRQNSSVSSAIERIRALRAHPTEFDRG
jgi:hypothetical protein